MVRQKMSRLAPELARPSSADYSRVLILRKIKRDKNQLSVQSYLKKPKKKVINTQDSLQVVMAEFESRPLMADGCSKKTI